ncbi:unnamed protein product [Adineta ricciae]|uniref:Uncharacterized protein n=1 Tax=Adineta ricciae TaxID=249248 RepID=A0A816HMU0_ADIRI|nr:unnamed protein product [Adineta ricciae]
MGRVNQAISFPVLSSYIQITGLTRLGTKAGSIPMTLTIASSLLGLGVCNTGTIQMGQFYGSVDELRVYAREFSSLEVFALVNP